MSIQSPHFGRKFFFYAEAVVCKLGKHRQIVLIATYIAAYLRCFLLSEGICRGASARLMEVTELFGKDRGYSHKSLQI